MFADGAHLRFSGLAKEWTVRRTIGQGSQGVVFEVTAGGGESWALKWYYPYTATSSQRRVIEELIDRGSPSPAFLWPQEIVSIVGTPGFGYLMPLREARYASLSELLNGKVDVPFSIVCTLAMRLADAFLSLHAEGLCYRDISFGNVFFDPQTGDPLVCDNDNVGVDGMSPSLVLGTPRFMAPEIVLSQASPSTATDLFSLSVLLFYLFMVGHPLLGANELQFSGRNHSSESDLELFGRQPVFIFDPSDVSNRPLAEFHGPVADNWQLHPEFIKDLFIRAFGLGLTDPLNGRVRESVWRSAASRLRDSIVICPFCRCENYYERRTPARRCWSCDRTIPVPVQLVFPSTTLVLNAGTAVYPHHLIRNYDFSDPVAQVVQREDQVGWGLRNLGARAWRAQLPNGIAVEIAPGRALSLVGETVIDFGSTEARITS